MDIKILIDKLRYRLIEFRLKEKENGISYHMSSINIVIALVEYALNTKRPIKKEEEGWFDAGYYLSLLLHNSEWKDIVDMYFEVVTEVENRSFFR